jgi:type IV pilus assembly protein PilE
MCRPADSRAPAAGRLPTRPGGRTDPDGSLRRWLGYSLTELMITLAVVAVLATVALPGLQQQIRKTRRADAIAAVLRVQQAQERYRSLQPVYAPSLGSGGLGLGATSPAGHYLLSSSAASGAEGRGYQVQAVAQGTQAQDADCRYLVLRVEDGQFLHSSGAQAEATNPASANRACWGQ